MKKLVAIVGISFLIAVVLGSPERSQACSCAGERPPCEAFTGARAIFVGQAIGGAQQIEGTDEDGSKTLYDVGEIRFAVEESFVGVKDAEVVIHSGTGGGDCGYWFRHGERYLVYAYGKPNKLYTHICTRTRPLERAEEDLYFLRNLPNSGVGGSLSGFVIHYAGDFEWGPTEVVGPMTGVKVIVEGDKSRFEAVTDSAGKYHVLGLPAGEYRVTPVLPRHLGIRSQYETADGSGAGGAKIRIEDRGCAGYSFLVYADGRIAGRITDAKGRPVKEARADLVPLESPGRGRSALSDEEGRYEFRLVQPGRYFLGINIQWAPKPDYPYPRTYYPGVRYEAEAMIIEIESGTRLSGYDLVLRAPLIQRAVEGVVIWPNGRPARGASLRCEFVDFTHFLLPETPVADDEGRFSIELFEGLAYYVSAEARRPDGDYVHSKPLEVVPGKGAGRIALILTEPGMSYQSIQVLRKARSK